MAFASAVTHNDIIGQNRVAYGTFSQASGDTGGVITTGLYLVKNFQMSSSVVGVSVSGGAVTVVTVNPAATVAGFWMAVGL